METQTETQKEYLNKFTKEQKLKFKKRILESYKLMNKKQEGYKSQGFKLPNGLNSKKIIPYTYEVSKEKANKEHKIMYALNILYLTQECKYDKKVINMRIKILTYLFKEDLEVLNIIKKVREVLR